MALDNRGSDQRLEIAGDDPEQVIAIPQAVLRSSLYINRELALIHFNERRVSFPDPLGIGTDFSLVGTIAAEVLCSLLLVIGLMTRVAALPVAFTMAVAAFVVNAGKPWTDKELAVLYMLCSLALVFTGAGRFSVDSRIERRKED